MAPVLRNSRSRTAAAMAASANPTTAEPPYSALTSAGESLFMCSSKEGHTCYHACRGHGRYPLWSDEDFMVDDVDEDEPVVEEKKKEEVEQNDNDDGSSSEYEFDSDEEWISDADRESEAQFWREIQESVARTRESRRIHYSATDLRFLPEPGREGSAMEHATATQGPLVGVIHTKPPPEYVWYLSDDSESWMRGSLPEKLSQEPDGAYHRYKYHVWDRIAAEDVHDSDSNDEDYEEEWEEMPDDERSSWSDLADQQEQRQQVS